MKFRATARIAWPLPNHRHCTTAGPCLNYLRKTTVSRKLAWPVRPSGVRTAMSLAQAEKMRNGAAGAYVSLGDDPWTGLEDQRRAAVPQNLQYVKDHS